MSNFGLNEYEPRSQRFMSSIGRRIPRPPFTTRQTLAVDLDVVVGDEASEEGPLKDRVEKKKILVDSTEYQIKDVATVEIDDEDHFTDGTPAVKVTPFFKYQNQKNRKFYDAIIKTYKNKKGYKVETSLTGWSIWIGLEVD